MSERMCPVCHVRPSRPQAVTCGMRCGYTYRKLQTRDPRPCPTCGKDFMPYPSNLARASGKYCSRKCYLAVVNVRPAMAEATCARCGQTFLRTQAALRRVKVTFCGNDCARAYRRGEHHPAWRGGHDPNRGPGWIALAERMRARDGHRCRKCGRTQADNGERLSVDHIIPWRSFTDAAKANDPANLASLCRSCHAKKAAAERRWLNGDVLDMWRYQVAVSQPWVDR